MDVENSESTRIWLERQADLQTAASQKFKQKKFKLSKETTTDIQTLLTEKHVKWDVLIAAAWAQLLHRFSSSNIVNFAKTSSNGKISNVTGELDDADTLLSYLHKIKTQKKSPLVDGTRYLLDFSTKIDLKALANFLLIVKTHEKFTPTLTIYYSAYFDEPAVKSIYEHLVIILKKYCRDIQVSATRFEILSNYEHAKILTDWKAPKFDFECPVITESLPDLFERAAEKAPSSLAIKHNELNVSYQELDQASTWLAIRLLEQHIQPGDKVCILMERTPVLIMAMLAIMRAGGIYVPINPKYPSERIEYVLRDSNARIVIVDNADILPNDYLKNSIVLPDKWEELNYNKNNDKSKLPRVTVQDLAYIIYTSGTTGNPKGVMIKHASLSNLIAWYYGCFGLSTKDRASQFASQAFDTFLCETVPYLASGASIHIINDNIKLTPPALFEWLAVHEITIADLPTAYLQILFTLPWPLMPALRIVKVGGERLTRYPHQNFSFDIWNIYGPTEDTIESTFMKIHSAGDKRSLEKKHFLPLIGKPLINCYAYVVDKYHQPVPPGIAGELLLGGIDLSIGYLNRPELTDQKFINNDIEPHLPGKLYKTGDLVRWQEDGNLEYIGRIDHQVKIRGYRIELGEIEKSLTEFPDVNEVVVIAKENVRNEKSLIAYVVPNLNKVRYLYQERCLIAINNNKYIEAISEDLSQQGMAISSITETIAPGTNIKINIKLPGLTEQKWLHGQVIWQQNNRCGIHFNNGTADRELVKKSIEYLLMTHNVMEMILSASAKRSLSKALKKHLPEYMIPNTFVTLLQFPMTFSGKIDLKALPPPQDFEQLLQKEHIQAKTPTEEIISEIWSRLLDKRDISMSDNFFDLGGNSLKAAELSISLLKQFNISVPVNILFDLSYIPVLAKYIDSKGTYTDAVSATQIEIERDRILPENITPTCKLSKHLDKPKNILLTGAGGFLGIYLLRELLATTDAKIHCLVRRGEFETAAKKINSTIQKFGLQNDISLSDKRIIAIASDISLHNFGLPAEHYNALLDKIDLIYHCGAQVNIMAAYSKLRGSNVTGTLEIIKFATTRVDKPIHYISTLSSAYIKDLSGALTESFPSEKYSELFGGYAISKWVSERLLTELKDRGLPIALYRSGYISGQSDTGVASLNDALFMLIKGCIQLGYAPAMHERITILPVDIVSQIITGISLYKPAKAAVYHIDHPTGIMWTDLIAWLNKYGYKIKTISLQEWQKKLVNISHDNALFPFLPYYLAMPKDYHSPDVSTTEATRILNEIQIPYPAINDQLLNIYFDYMQSVGFLPRIKEKITRSPD